MVESIDPIGVRIRCLREKSRISQAQMADYLKMDQSMISKIENGERNPNLEMIDALSSLFGCDVEGQILSDKSCESLTFAFRANSVSSEDMQTIASVNRIAMNLREMKDISRRTSI